MERPLRNLPFSLDTTPTLRQALVWAERYLIEAGIPDPRLSAEVLMGAVLGLDRLRVFLSQEKSLSETEWTSFKDKIHRRAQHEPVAYLTGHREFWSLDFEVNPAVLIPRPETELLVEETLAWISRRTGRTTLVELGTGSGAVAISVAKSIARGRPLSVLATDLSWSALRIAAKNAGHHEVRDSIALVRGNWLEPFSDKRRWIDLLVSNPPYISEKEIFHLPTTVKGYEPVKALLAGRDGLEAIRIILEQAERQLKVGGRLILEIGETQGKKVLELASAHKFVDPRLRQDYSGKERILSAGYHG